RGGVGGRRQGGDRQAGAHRRQLLAERYDALELHPSVATLRRAGRADAGRGVRGDGLSAVSQRDHRRERRSRCEDAAAGEDAEPRRLRARLAARRRADSAWQGEQAPVIYLPLIGTVTLFRSLAYRLRAVVPLMRTSLSVGLLDEGLPRRPLRRVPRRPLPRGAGRARSRPPLPSLQFLVGWQRKRLALFRQHAVDNLSLFGRIFILGHVYTLGWIEGDLARLNFERLLPVGLEP